MDDTVFRHYFTQPTQVYHRQYEALRALMVDGRSQKEVAEAFGFRHRSLRQLLYEFRCSFDTGRRSMHSPFFKPSRGSARPPARKIKWPRQSPTGRR
jgi:phage regulator Rha-like protein